MPDDELDLVEAYGVDDEEHDDDNDEGYCPACSGSGEGQYDGTHCPVCHGRGE